MPSGVETSGPKRCQDPIIDLVPGIASAAGLLLLSMKNVGGHGLGVWGTIKLAMVAYVLLLGIVLAGDAHQEEAVG